MGHRLILASASPRRRDLLKSWGLAHTIQPADVEESLDGGLACGPQAQALATIKAMAVFNGRQHRQSQENKEAWILGADTIVSCCGVLLGKPKDSNEAREMLEGLSGQIVEVATGVSVVGGTGQVFEGFELTKLEMFPFGAKEICDYVATGEPMGKAGAFAIQGLGGNLIKEFTGSFSNVVGLPKELVLRLLDQAGFPFGA